MAKSGDYIPITWKNVTGPSNASANALLTRSGDALGAAVEGLGDNVGQFADDKQKRETDAFIAELNALGSDKERNELLAQADTGWKNLERINTAITDAQNQDFRVADEARRVAGEARTAEEYKYGVDILRPRETALHADAMLTSKADRTYKEETTALAKKTFKHAELQDALANARSDEDLARLWESDAFTEEKFEHEKAFQIKQHQLEIDKQKHTVMQDNRSASNKAEEIARLDRIQDRLDDKAEFEREKFKEGKEDRDLTTKTKQLTLEEKQFAAIEADRTRTNKATVRQSLSVMEEVRRDFKNIPGGEATIRKQLETSIAENKGFGITDIEQKALIDQYNKVLADDRTIKITQDDLDTAFGVGNPPDYTAAGKLRLQDALFSRITGDYTQATTAAAESKAKNVVNKSKYAAKYANPLISAFDAMEAVSKPDPKTGAVNSKKVISTYFNKRRYIADNWPKQLDEFDGEWKDAALNSANVDLNLISLKKTKLKNEDGSNKLDRNDKQEYSKTFESIISKPNDQISKTDLARYEKSIKQQLTKMGFKNLKPEELAIVIENSEAGVVNLSEKMRSVKALHAAQLQVSTGQMVETVNQTLQTAKTETEVNKATQTLITTANHAKQAVTPTQEAYMKYLKDTEKDNGIDGTDLENAIRKLDDILIERSPTLKAGERAHILMNFLKAHSSVQTWSASPDVVIDFDENGLIETTSLGIMGDKQVIDIEGNAQTNKVFRMMMEKTGLNAYPSKAKEALKLIYGNQKTNNDNIITDNTALLEQLSDSKIFGKTPAGVQAQIDKLKKQIAKATSDNAILARRRKKWNGGN